MIINTIRRFYAGYGSPTVWNQNQNFNITNGNTTVCLPVGTNTSQTPLQNGLGPITVGIVRVKTEAAGTLVNTGNLYPNASLFRVIQIIGDDGSSNQVQLYQGDAAQTAANVNVDYFYEFATDLPLANVNVVINVQNINATGNAVMSVEVAAGP